MCIACEMGFLDIIEALPPDARERILREQDAAARFVCEAPVTGPERASLPKEDEPAP
jgi:hypothetical protein